MLAVFHHDEPASLMDIRKYLLDKSRKDWAIASPYIALDKLKKKGFVESFKGEAKQVRGGKALRYYLLTKRGIKALEEAWKIQESMWKDFVRTLSRSNLTDE